MPDAAATTALLYERTGDLVTTSRQGVAGVSFRAYITAVDDIQLDDRFLTNASRLRYPTAAAQLREGDEIHHAGARYRLLQSPRRVADGHECEALLTPLT